MRSVVSARAFGTVARLLPSCGFILGENGTEYFFLPSMVQAPDFLDLREGQRVTYVPFLHPRGWRANGVVLTELDEVPCAEAHSVAAPR